MMNWGHMTGGGWTLSGIVAFAMVLLLTIIIVRALASRTTMITDNVDRARDILAERFARGEIDVDEYRERLEELNQHDLRHSER